MLSAGGGSGTLPGMDVGLGHFLRSRRQYLRLRQADVASEAGISPSHYARIEAGRISLPSPEVRRGIARALGLNHLDLLVRAGELLPEEVDLSDDREDFPRRSKFTEAMRVLADLSP